MFKASITLMLLLSFVVVKGQVSITSLPQTYSQNFDAALGTTSLTWSHNSTVTGWYISSSSPLAVNTGTTNANACYNFGIAGTNPLSDRALGAISTSTTHRFGVRVANNSGSSITSFDISFTGEQWRAFNAGTLTFHYQTGTTVTSLTTGTWTAVTALDFSELVTGSGSALDGNNSSNRTPKSYTLSVSVPSGTEIFFRWQKSGTSSPGLAIDDLVITANGAATPTINVTPTTLTGFNYIQGSGPSASQTYSLSGSNLTGAPGNITVTGSTNYEVSTDDATFSGSLTVPYGSATLSSTTIYVRLKSGLTAASYNSETIANSGGGASTQNVTCSGTVSPIPSPTLTCTPTTLTGFNYIQGSGPSASQTYSLSGSNLTGAPGNITVTGSTNYEVSTDDATFSGSVTVPYGSATLSSTTIYVRLKSGLTAASYNSETIANSGGGASTQNVTCSGTVSPIPSPTLTCTPTTLTGFNYTVGAGPSASQTYSLSGSNLTGAPGNITVTGSSNYEVSTDHATFSASVSVPYGSATLSSTTIYVRLKSGLTAASYNSETIANSGGGASTQNVTCSGTVTGASSTCLSEDFTAEAKPTDWVESNISYSESAGKASFNQNTGYLTTISVSYPTSLDFTLARTTNSTPKTLYVKISTTSQTSGFTTVATYDTSNTISGGTTNCSVDLSAYSSQPVVYIRFEKSSSTASPWRLDNIEVSCSGVAPTPASVLSDNGTQVTAGNVNQGTANHILSKFKLDISGASTTLDTAYYITSGDYVAADIAASGLKLWYNSANDFSSATALQSATSTAAGGGEIIGFEGFSKALATGTHYFWITASIASSATVNHTISVDAIGFADLGFLVETTQSGTSAAGGTQTIKGNGVITLSGSSLTGFSAYQGSSSASQNITVSGDYLTGSVTVTAPTNFEISTDDISFSGSITLSQTSGNIDGEPVTIYIRIANTASLGAVSGNVSFASTGVTTQNCSVSGNVIKNEPTNHPTVLACGTSNSTDLTISWTDASAGISPDGYLIKWSSVSYGAITDPVDGVAEANGSGVLNIAQGVSAATLTSLAVSTTYFIKIWPYTNSGSDINYKTGGVVEQVSCSTIDGPCLFEQFSSGALPSGWASTNVNFTVNAGTASLNATSGDITSPVISNPNELRFDLLRSTSATAKTLEVQVSTTSQSSGFTTIKTFDHNNTVASDTNVCVIDLSAYSANTTVYIRLNKPTSTTAVWKIDNFRVYCGSSTSNSQAVLADNLPQVTAGDLYLSTSNNVISKFKVDVSNLSTFLDTFKVVLTGTFTSSDISASGLKLLYNETDNSASATTLGTLTSSKSGASEILIFSGLQKSLVVGTHYFWVTASISGAAVHGNTIQVSSFSYDSLEFIGSISASGSVSQAGLKTIKRQPEISLSIASLTGFTAFQGTPSASQSYTVSANYLIDDVTLTAPSNFEISTDNTNFSSSLVLSNSGGDLASEPVTIYVRIITNPVVGLVSGNITHTSTGATTQNCAVDGEVIKYEPTNQPTGFNCSDLNPTSIQVSWVDATGTVLPDGYLVKWSQVGYGSIANPVDGTAEANGANTLNITQGTQSALLTGLTQGTTYFVKIWPYTNSGSDIDYKTDGTIEQSSCATTTGACLEEDFTSNAKPSGWDSLDVRFQSGVASFESNNGYMTPLAVSNPTELRFDLSRTTSSTSKNMIIEVSTTSQTSGFSTVQTFTNSNVPSGGTATLTVDLSTYQAEPTVYIRFRKASSTTAYWQVDNISVQCGYSNVAPATQASNIVFSSILTTSMDVSWTSGNGARRIVKMNTANSFTSPVNGTDPAANSTYSGSGEQVVYNGIGNSVSVDGLTAGTTYWFRVYEYENTGINTLYNTSTATGNPASQFTTPKNVSNFSVNCISKTSANISWTPPTGTYQGVIIAMRESTNAVHSISGRGDTLTANNVFGTGSFFGSTTPYSYVVYNGTGNSLIVHGLTPGASYTFKAYTYNQTFWSSGSSKSAQVAEVSDISALQYYAPNHSIVINWTNPVFSCADEIMVVAKSGSAVTTNPIGDGSSYTANTTFGSGTDIGTGEYVVYKGVNNHTTISGLTNGTEYFFKIFVRDGSDWSTGVEGSDTPEDITVLLPGKLAVVALNTAYGGSSPDQISIVCFDTLKTGTAIDFTDNGWERENPNYWGNTEGTVRFTRTGPPVLPGEVFTFTGIVSQPNNYTKSGLTDNSWAISSLNGLSGLDLNSTDQLWVMQFGSWDHGVALHDASYSGNVLYGWTATGWAGDPGHGAHGTTSYSALYPNATCFNTNVVGTTNKDKVKYVGDTTATTTRDWITRINNSANWVGYADNGDYDDDAMGYPYSDGITFRILPDVNANGTWIGDKDTNWFDCNNWSDLTVPDENTDVVIDVNANSNAVIDITLDYAEDFEDTARCRNLTITKKRLTLRNSDDYLVSTGDITINGGRIIQDFGKISLHGDFTNQQDTGFTPGNGTVIFNGFNQQNIENQSYIEVFNNLEVKNNNGVKLKSSVEVDSLIFTLGKFEIDTANIEISGSIINPDESRYVVTKDLNSSPGFLIMEAMTTETLFPIGLASSYNPCYISNPGGAAQFKARVFSGLYENGISGNLLTGSIVNRSWEIKPVNPAGISATVKLQWSILEETGGFDASRLDARIIKNMNTGSGTGFTDWVELGNSTVPSGTNPFTIESSSITTFSTFGIKAGCVKPITSLIYHF